MHTTCILFADRLFFTHSKYFEVIWVGWSIHLATNSWDIHVSDTWSCKEFWDVATLEGLPHFIATLYVVQTFRSKSQDMQLCIYNTNPLAIMFIIYENYKSMFLQTAKLWCQEIHQAINVITDEKAYTVEVFWRLQPFKAMAQMAVA